MKNVVDELDLLKMVLDNELSLRQATDVEFRNGVQNGPMRQAHDAAILQVVAAARALVVKASS